MNYYSLNRKCNKCGIRIMDQNKSDYCNVHRDRSGKNNSFYGKKHKEETKKQMSKNNAKCWLGKKRDEKTKKLISLSHIGKHHSLESNEKNKISHLGKIPWNKGKKMSEKYKEICRKAFNTEECKRKKRLAMGKRIQANNGIRWPSYNIEGSKYFKHWDVEHNTKGHYAENGNGGEKYLEDLGYWPDYYNDELKIIMEYDEPHHFNLDGKLKERDVKRQQEIKKAYSDFKFIRINAITKETIEV